MSETNPIFHLGLPKEIEIPASPQSAQPIQLQPGQESFQTMFNSFLKDVNEMQHKADQSVQKMMTGEIKDVHQVMLAVGEAKVAFNLLLEIRNKTMEAYKEILSMKG
jgi:flagellar hook-basal body complex protein FliE